MSDEDQPTGSSHNIRKAIWPLVLGALCYIGFLIYLVSLPRWMHGVEYQLLPSVSIAIGVMIGYRTGRYGWALAAIPPLLLFGPITLVAAWPPSLPHIAYRLPVSVLGAMFGGFLGAHLVRRA